MKKELTIISSPLTERYRWKYPVFRMKPDGKQEIRGEISSDQVVIPPEMPATRLDAPVFPYNLQELERVKRAHEKEFSVKVLSSNAATPENQND